MNLEIDKRIFEKFPGLNIGVVIANGINNTGVPEEIQAALREQEKSAREKYILETLSQQPKIDAWRKAYSAFGGKPKENRSSVENLHRMVLQGISLRHINKLVDIYNFISLKYALPVGGEDIDKISGNISLTFAGANEASVMLLGDKDIRPPHEGEVIYKDDISAICRRFNWREADRTKLTEGTTNSVLVLEGLPPAERKEIEAATLELKGLVQKHCGGNLKYAVLDVNNTKVILW